MPLLTGGRSHCLDLAKTRCCSSQFQNTNLIEKQQLPKGTYCWWKKSYASWCGEATTIYKGFIHPRWLAGFLPSTAVPAPHFSLLPVTGSLFQLLNTQLFYRSGRHLFRLAGFINGPVKPLGFFISPYWKRAPKKLHENNWWVGAHLVSPNSSGNLQEGPGTWRGFPESKRMRFSKIGFGNTGNPQGRGTTSIRGWFLTPINGGYFWNSHPKLWIEDVYLQRLHRGEVGVPKPATLRACTLG